MNLDIAILGASAVNDNGVLQVQAVSPVGASDDDIEPFGQIDVFQSLGVYSVPYPKDASGYAEGLIGRDVGNRDAVLIGARDTRTQNVVGAAKPGDTIVHSTGPNQAAQLQLKEEKKQACLVSKDSKGQTMLAMLDGKNDQAIVAALGCVFEMKQGEITLTNGTASIMLQGGDIVLNGTIRFPGIPPGFKLAAVPIATPNTNTAPVAISLVGNVSGYA